MPPNLREVFAENEPSGEIASLFSAKCLAIVLPSASYSVAFFALKVFKFSSLDYEKVPDVSRHCM